MIRFVQNHPGEMHLRETTERLTLICDKISSIQQAIERIDALTNQKTDSGIQ